MLMGSLKAPYSTAGMLPSFRVRRASFFPREARTSAVTVISFLKTYSFNGIEVRFTLRKTEGYVGSSARFTYWPRMDTNKNQSNSYSCAFVFIRGPILYTNKLLTDVSSWIDLIAAAI